MIAFIILGVLFVAFYTWWLAREVENAQPEERDAEVIEWPQIVGSNVIPLHKDGGAA